MSEFAPEREWVSMSNKVGNDIWPLYPEISKHRRCLNRSRLELKKNLTQRTSDGQNLETSLVKPPSQQLVDKGFYEIVYSNLFKNKEVAKGSTEVVAAEVFCLVHLNILMTNQQPFICMSACLCVCICVCIHASNSFIWHSYRWRLLLLKVADSLTNRTVPCPRFALNTGIQVILYKY